jgi:hypothetical protein
MDEALKMCVVQIALGGLLFVWFAATYTLKNA